MVIYTWCQGKPGVCLVVISGIALIAPKVQYRTIPRQQQNRSIRGLECFVHWASLVSRNSNADPLFHLAIDACVRSKRPSLCERGSSLSTSPTNLKVEGINEEKKRNQALQRNLSLPHHMGRSVGLIVSRAVGALHLGI